MKNVYSNIKNTEIKQRIIVAKKVMYNASKHLKLSDLGYKTIFQISDLSKKRWEEYFKNNGKIYIDKKSDKVFVPSYKLFLFDLNSKILSSSNKFLILFIRSSTFELPGTTSPKMEKKSQKNLTLLEA